MPEMVVVTEDVYSRLRQLARFSGCDEGEVVRRLLDRLDADESADDAPVPRRSRVRVDGVSLSGRYLPGRAPRERGAQIRIGHDTFRVSSVRDMLETTLRYLSKNGKNDALRSLLPFKTSSQRYLIAAKPVHPNGNPFFVPVQHGGMYMEAHKSYKTAIADLRDFLGQLNIPFEYISG